MASRPAGRPQKRRPRSPRSALRPRQNSVTQTARRAAILERLQTEYGDATTALEFSNPFELLVAVILSAQCTDKRVNMVTPALFRAYPTVEKLARAKARDVERYIKSCGLYHTKAKNLVSAARTIVARFGGRVPEQMDDLLALPGVGRKTANVIRAVAYDADAIAVDTHVFRVANRLGLVRANNPRETERQLMDVIPQRDWSKAHHWLIYHGRQVCHARHPECARCVVVDLCPSAKKFLATS